MKPAPFAYFAPTSLPAALELIAEHGETGKLLAGGQSLVPTMNFRLAQPAALVDLNRVSELDYIMADGRGGLLIGAMTRHRTVERSTLVARHAPLLHATMPYIAHVQIRNRGTIGGSLAHADPAADWPLVMATLGASLRLVGPRGERMVAADRFASAAYATDLAPDEVLVEVRVPPLAADARWAYRKFCRKPGEFALAQAACLFEPSRGRARVFLGAPAAAPTELPALAQRIAGGSAAERALDRLAAEVDRVLPGVAADRRQIAAVMLQRALEEVYA